MWPAGLERVSHIFWHIVRTASANVVNPGSTKAERIFPKMATRKVLKFKKTCAFKCFKVRYETVHEYSLNSYPSVDPWVEYSNKQCRLSEEQQWQLRILTLCLDYYDFDHHGGELDGN